MVLHMRLHVPTWSPLTIRLPTLGWTNTAIRLMTLPSSEGLPGSQSRTMRTPRLFAMATHA